MRLRSGYARAAWDWRLHQAWGDGEVDAEMVVGEAISLFGPVE